MVVRELRFLGDYQAKGVAAALPRVKFISNFVGHTTVCRSDRGHGHPYTYG